MRSKKPRRLPPRPRSSSSQPLIPPAQLPVRDAIRDGLQVSVPTGYDLIARGVLKTFLIGRRRYTTPQDVIDCVAILRAEGAAP